MNSRLQHLQLRKEALTLRAALERVDLAVHLAALRRPSEITYKGLRLISLLRVPVAALIAARLGGRSGAVGGSADGVLSQLVRYAGIAFAGWRFYRGVHELFMPQRPPPL